MTSRNDRVAERPPLRVLAVIDSLTTAGAEILLCSTARALAARGDTEVAIAILYPVLKEAWRLEGTSIPVIWLGMHDKRDLGRGARRLRAELAAFRPDIVHTHLFPADLVTVLATRGSRDLVPLILSEHAESNRRRRVPFSRHLEGWIYGHYNRIVCVSGLVEASVTAWIPAVRGRTTVIANAVEVPASRWVAEGPFATDLIFVGRLFEQKGFDILVEALLLLRARGVRPSLWVLGEGPRRAEYERLVARHDLGDQVQLIGRRPNAQALMPQARALVMPSRFEGLSMVLLEAMALGMPVVATAVSGASEVIRADWSGILVPPLDAGALADGIAAVLLDPESARRLGENARETISQHFSMRAYASRLRELYEQAGAATGF